ncbi:MAG: hypothetical protein ABR972_15475 [Acidimicrobiales bacterium]
MHREHASWCQSPGRSSGAGDTYVSGTNVPLDLGFDRAVVRAANASPNGPSVNGPVSPVEQIADSPPVDVS